MIDQPANHRQLDLLVPTARALEPSRMPRATRVELTALLKLLMADHIVAGPAVPLEAADE
jgi:hypothetical protein